MGDATKIVENEIKIKFSKLSNINKKEISKFYKNAGNNTYCSVFFFNIATMTNYNKYK